LKDRAEAAHQRCGGEHDVLPFLAGQVVAALERRKYASPVSTIPQANCPEMGCPPEDEQDKTSSTRHGAMHGGHASRYQAMTL
jgi:hypothetical protein